MAKEDSISAKALMMPQEKGMKVDIRKDPAVYTPLNLRFALVSTCSDMKGVDTSSMSRFTHSPPTMFPAIHASITPTIK